MDFMTMAIVVLILLLVLKFIKASFKLMLSLGLIVVAAWLLVTYLP